MKVPKSRGNAILAIRSILLTLLNVFLASAGLGFGSSFGSVGGGGALLAMVASPGSLAMLGAKAVAVAAV